MLTKKNSLQSEPYTAKLCLSVVLKHFGGNSWGTFLFSQKKWLSQKGALKKTESFFPYHIWKGANPVENLDLFKQLFLIKQLKGDKY